MSIQSNHQWTLGKKTVRHRKVNKHNSRALDNDDDTFIAGNFYSSSDSESEDEVEKKIHVEIKPLNNGIAPISASVDELRATVENLSLSPIGALSVKLICFDVCTFAHFIEAFFCFKFFFYFLCHWKMFHLKKKLDKFLHVLFIGKDEPSSISDTCFLIYCISMPSFISFMYFLLLAKKNCFMQNYYSWLTDCIILALFLRACVFCSKKKIRI